MQARADVCTEPNTSHAVQVLAPIEGDTPLPAPELPCARHLFLTCLKDLDRTFAPSMPVHKRTRHNFLNRVVEAVRAKDKGHIMGHRYALVDTAAGAPLATATPRRKLAAATSESAQAVLSQLWCDAQQQAAAERRAARAGACATAQAAGSMEPESQQAGAAAVSDGAQEAVQGECSAEQQAPEQAGCTADAAPAAADEPQADASHDAGADASTADAGQSAGQQASAAPVPQDRRAGARSPDSRQPPMHMEVVAQTPSKKWLLAQWMLHSEFLHIDDSGARDSTSIAAATRNARSMVDAHFPGAVGV